MNATEATGDFSIAALSRDIQTWIRENINLAQIKKFYAVNNEEYSHILFSVAIGSSTVNNYTMMMDYRFDPPRWASWPAFESASLTSMVDASDRNRRIVLSGDKDGFLSKYNRSTGNIRGDHALSYKIKTPFFNYGSAIELKSITQASVSVVRKNDADITYSYVRDEEVQQEVAITQSGFDTLDNFILDTSALGGSTIVDRFVELTEGGQFRSIQYEISSTDLTEFQLHAFGAVINLNEGWSTE